MIAEHHKFQSIYQGNFICGNMMELIEKIKQLADGTANTIPRINGSKHNINIEKVKYF